MIRASKSKMHHPTKILTSGGVFSTPKVNYSKDTQDLVNLMMKESHLSNLQKTGFNSILRSGESLPSNSHEMMKQRFQMKRKAMGKALGLNDSSSSLPSSSRRNRRTFPPNSGRRTLEQIRASGAYDPTPQRPYVPANNKKEKEIARLQYHMTYGSSQPPEGSLLSKSKAKEKNLEEEKSARLAELVDEIGDRIEFLSSMNQIGRDKVYRSMIEFQIREKLTELEKNHPKEISQVVDHFGLQKFMTKIELP
ncbi:unnamed protein product [Allacma fusca]|uniref:Uncharacterized protein n=1 Tax=Allacma fusca TaxID=39272 RepID=A0A8J2LD67_9HEXA|nr:unnamed protein product [Allacma fusca]